MNICKKNRKYLIMNVQCNDLSVCKTDLCIYMLSQNYVNTNKKKITVHIQCKVPSDYPLLSIIYWNRSKLTFNALGCYHIT